MSSNQTIDINWQPGHYVSRFWLEKSDPYVSKLPFMPIGFPIYWISFVAMIGILIRWIIPAYMMDRKPLNVRPYALVLDGLAFGGYATALITIMIPANYFKDCFDCSAYSARSQRLDHLVVKHFAFGVIFAKLFDLTVPLLYALAKKPVSDLHLAYLLTTVIGTVSLVKINPGGIFMFAAMVDGLYSVVLYSYLTFTAADPRFRPSGGWKTAVFFSKMLCWCLIIAHSAYFLSIPDCGEPIIKLLLVGLSFLVLTFYPYDFYRMNQRVCETRANHVPNGTGYKNECLFTAVADILVKKAL
jgi:hypothetical protein